MADLFDPPLPQRAGDDVSWQGLTGSAIGLAVTEAARRHRGLTVVITDDPDATYRMRCEVEFFGADTGLPVLTLPDWETLAYDAFSPHQDIVSERLLTLYRLPRLAAGVLIVPVGTLLQRLAPQQFLDAHSLIIQRGDRFDLDAYRARFEQAGYTCVETVRERGEFAVRGSLVDIFPMGAADPIRIDLFDDEVDTLRLFEADSQRTVEQVSRIELLPAKEFPMSAAAIARFRDNWHANFDVDVRRCPMYQDISQGISPSGIEYYLPLFFESLATLFDYLPNDSLIISDANLQAAAKHFLNDVDERYESLRHDLERPILEPARLYQREDELFGALRGYRRVVFDGTQHASRFESRTPPDLTANTRAQNPAERLSRFMATAPRTLFCADSPGRRELLWEFLTRAGLATVDCEDFATFRDGSMPLGITVAPVERSLWISDMAIVGEAQIFGRRSESPGRSGRRGVDPDQVIRNLTELNIGAPVVHLEHGVGRYRGLTTLDLGSAQSEAQSQSEAQAEFLTIEYAEGALLYVPVASLHLISRYAGADAESAPMHRLGSDQWDKAKRKAAEKIHDVAAELLDIYARREARAGTALARPDEDYQRFADQFAFDATPDQRAAIDAVTDDLCSARAMDRLICGDVGFGKTEVAMQAAFLAAQNGKQVALLVPTTLLAQQHFENFRDRFADWPVQIEVVSRLRSDSEVEAARQRLASGKVDICIGTHKLLNKAFVFKDLGLVIIDEEHRFGVRQKERLRTLRAEVDVLTLTATPIPRTLNMAMGGIRDLSIIATPPAKRLSIKTFVQQRRKHVIREAISRELMRGGQVFYLHNEVRTIEQTASELEALVPEARIGIGHGQMPKRALERVMGDFYHRRSNVLVCTTIIETGIDIPNANTIIMDRADKFGLAQLHQLRGRVGRSHRQAYAYLLAPHPKAMTNDARKRLEAIEAAGELGVGFTLATHDMEIRGAGELLGDEQSGQIESIGFSLYMDMLDRAVKAIESGTTFDLDVPLETIEEVNLHFPALIPDDYLPDVHTRLIMYKRIASAASVADLDELRAEMIDRFGQLPAQVRNLFTITELKLAAQSLGLVRIDIGQATGRVEFGSETRVDPLALVRLVQREPNTFRLDGGTRLRITRNLEDPDQRVDFVHELLDRLTPRADTDRATANVAVGL